MAASARAASARRESHSEGRTGSVPRASTVFGAFVGSVNCLGNDVFVITYRSCVQKRAVLRRDAGVLPERLLYLCDRFELESLVQFESSG